MSRSVRLLSFAGLRSGLWIAGLGVTSLSVGCNGPDADTKRDDSADARENVAPVLTIDRPVEGGMYPPGGIPLYGFVADDVDAADTLAISLESSRDGALLAPAASVEGNFSTVLRLSEGEHTLTLTAMDSDGASSAASVTLQVVPPAQNNAPTTPAVHIQPLIPQTGDALSLVVDVESVDPDGDALDVYTRWTRDGALVAEDVDEIDGAEVGQGQVWEVEYWTSDGQAESAHVVASVTIGNGAPIFSSVTLSPAAPTVLTDLACVAVAADPEGEAITLSYRWSVDGADPGVSADTLPAGVAARGAEVWCEATASDGQNSAALASDPVIVGNEPPQPPTLAFDPADPADTDAFRCVLAAPAADPDAGDVIGYAYQWYRDGQPVAVSGDTVTADQTHRDEVWRCEVTATDAAGGSAPAAYAEVSIGRAWEDQAGAASADVTIDGLVPSGQFGKTLAMVGDTDGDGLSELLVGASGEGAGAGTIYLFSGQDLSGSLDTTDARSSWTSPWAGGSLGGYRAVAAPGDLDGDGLSELIVGAADADANGPESGVVLLIYGGGAPGIGQDIDAAADWHLLGDINDNLGVRMSAGDINGDGLSDLLVSAAGSSDYGRLAGVAALYLNPGHRWSGTGYLVDADRFIYGDGELEELGWTTREVGDVNGDGYDDWVTMSIYAQNSIGVLGLFFGSNALGADGRLSVEADALFTGDDAGDRLGYDTVGHFDADGDGTSELALGAYLDDTAGVDAGALHIYEGRSAWAGSLRGADADWIITGGAAGDRFGHVLGAPGDLDGDGTDDLLIGALLTEPGGLTDQGSAWVLLGPDLGAFSTATDLPWQSIGENGGDIYGDAVNFGRGDTDGDGRGDFAVGAQLHDAGGTDAGRVYLWRGR